MKRFDAKAELSKLERKRFITSNKKTLTNMLLPFFVIGFSCAALTFASYSLDDTGNVEEPVIRNDQEVVEVTTDKTINDDLGTSKYYFNNEHKYIKLNNMMFKIVRVNGDGTIRLILDGSITRDWNLGLYDNLNVWFKNNFINNPYVVKSYYDNNIELATEEVTDLMNMTSAMIDYVGLLSYREYKLMYVYDDTSNMFLYSIDMYNDRWCTKNGVLSTCKDYENYELRPVINIKNVSVKGAGTITDPYIIEE